MITTVAIMLSVLSRMPEELQPSKARKSKSKSKAAKEKAIESTIKNLGSKEVTIVHFVIYMYILPYSDITAAAVQ